MPRYWEPIKTDKRPWQPIVVVRYFYLVRLTIQLLCVAISTYGIILFVSAAGTIPKVLITSETGRVALGFPKPFVMEVANVQPLVQDVLTALYTRTEAGRVIQDLVPFVDPLVIRTIDSPFPDTTTAKDAGAIAPMSVSMVVLGTKFRFVRSTVMQVSFKTLLSSHGKDGEYKSSLVYFDTRWDRIIGSNVKGNPLGWQLTGIVTSTENLYNKEEILEEIKKNTAIVADVPLPDTAVTDESPKSSAPSSTKLDNATSISVPSLGAEK